MFVGLGFLVSPVLLYSDVCCLLALALSQPLTLVATLALCHSLVAPLSGLVAGPCIPLIVLLSSVGFCFACAVGAWLSPVFSVWARPAPLPAVMVFVICACFSKVLCPELSLTGQTPRLPSHRGFVAIPVPLL